MAKPDRLAIRRSAEKRGRTSETLAAALLILKGYRILGRRVKTPLGEIDLVARTPRGIVCFIEVKARETAEGAVESVAPRQQARIARAAALYLASRQGLDKNGVRFDVMAVAPGKIPRHFRDAWRP